jgi:hypothetical protein
LLKENRIKGIDCWSSSSWPGKDPSRKVLRGLVRMNMDIPKQKLTIRFLIILYIITFTNCELVSTDRTFFYIATKMMNASREYSTNFTRVISIFMMCCTSM